jgi:hypothetical protein
MVLMSSGYCLTQQQTVSRWTQSLTGVLHDNGQVLVRHKHILQLHDVGVPRAHVLVLRAARNPQLVSRCSSMSPSRALHTTSMRHPQQSGGSGCTSSAALPWHWPGPCLLEIGSHLQLSDDDLGVVQLPRAVDHCAKAGAQAVARGAKGHVTSANRARSPAHCKMQCNSDMAAQACSRLIATLCPV